jgi:AraC-like DNA-binding protein
MSPLLRGEEAESEISKRQRFADRCSLEEIFDGVEGDRHIRDERIHEAVMEHGYTLTALQKYLGLHPSTLSRIVKRIGEEKNARNNI